MRGNASDNKEGLWETTAKDSSLCGCSWDLTECQQLSTWLMAMLMCTLVCSISVLHDYTE